jgi:hypothetical protein
VLSLRYVPSIVVGEEVLLGFAAYRVRIKEMLAGN